MTIEKKNWREKYYWKKPDGNEDKMKEKDIYLRKCELHIDTKILTQNYKWLVKNS